MSDDETPDESRADADEDAASADSGDAGSDERTAETGQTTGAETRTTEAADGSAERTAETPRSDEREARANERENRREGRRDESANRDERTTRRDTGRRRRDDSDRDARRERAAREETAGGDLRPREVDRVFALLEETITSDVLGGRQLDRLLSILEQSVAGTADTNPETVAELVSMLEEVLLEPEDLSEVDVDGVLSIIEEAIAGTTIADRRDVADVFDVIEEGIRDPTNINPEDAERFRAGIENAIIDVTDPTGSVGGLFALPLLAQEDEIEEPVDTLRIARIAAALTQRATGYSMESGVRTGTRMAYAAANAESPVELLTSTRAIALDELQRAGIDIGDQQAAWLNAHEEQTVDPRPLTREELEERGARLISQSAEVGRDESVHPAFGSILEQLATDEARILRLLATEGPQGAIDVHDKTYVPFRTKLVAENLTMLGSDAGCRNRKRTPANLQNLQRLGLVYVSDRPIADLKSYEIIEAQSHIEAAREQAKRPKNVYKSVRLSDLGVDFCELCFPFEVTVDRETAKFREDDE